MKIAIFAPGRFYLLDLARELGAFGHDVVFYSMESRGRTREFGLPDSAYRGLLFPRAYYPLLALQIVLKKIFGTSSWYEVFVSRLLDRVAARRIEPCDVFIGMSGIALRSAETVRRKYGAKVWIIRGSRHVLSTKAILESIPCPGRRHLVPQWAVKAELESYRLADVIVVPARHVVESFLEAGESETRLFRNPYGVDLAMFPPTPALPVTAQPTIIMAGAWSLRKGCDVLLKAWRGMKGVKLLHIGWVTDLSLPNDPDFEHHHFVDQKNLPQLYSRGHILVMPSREEGLALVQPMGLACGLPLVCTTRTGGEDLKELVSDPAFLTVVPADDPTALRAAIDASLKKATAMTGMRDVLGRSRDKLSWREHARRYEEEFQKRYGVCHT